VAQAPFLRGQRERGDALYVLVVDFVGASGVEEGVNRGVMVALDGEKQGRVAVAGSVRKLRNTEKIKKVDETSTPIARGE